MQTTLTAKQGATGRVCASRTGKEQPGNKNMDGCWQHCLLSASRDMATACTLQWTQPRQYVWWSQRWRENTLQEQSMGWLGYETIFFPRIWLEGGMASLTQDCFSLVLSQRCKLQIHALLQHSERSSTNSSSALQFSSFSRFVQIEHYFVSKLFRVLRTSKIREIVLNMVSVCADENSEMQTNHWPVVSSTVWSRGCAAALTRPDSTPCILQLWQMLLNIFLTNAAEKSLLPGNHLRHLPLNFKSLKNSDTHTRRSQ